MDEIKSVIDQLQSTSSRNDKIAILTAHKNNDLWGAVLKFLFDPMVVTGMSSKKVNKAGEAVQNLNASLYDVLEYLKVHNTGTLEDVAFAVGFANSHPVHREWLLQLFTKSLKLGIDVSTVNKVYGKDFIKVFTVMLAESFADNPRYLDGKDFIITQKLDGCRCVAFVYSDGVQVKFFTRNGQDYGTVLGVAEELSKAAISSGVTGLAFDGELIASSDSLDTGEVFRQTVSTANSKGVKSNLIYNIFDVVPIEEFMDGYSGKRCTDRKAFLHSMFAGKDFHWIKEVDVLYEGNNQDAITEWSSIAQKLGWEGLMLNVADAPYQAKRVRDLLKVKKFKTVDVRVVSLFEGEGALKGTLGGVNVEFEVDGKVYTSKCGSGFTLSQRDRYWKSPELLLGKIVELKCFEVSTDKDGSRSLRFPIWLDIIRFDKNDTSVV